MKEYVFIPYDKRYPAQFQREKQKLMKILPFAGAIEHFGSTSVKGLFGKGVIDIYVIVRTNDFKKSHELMERAEYVYYGTKEREGGFSMVFRKSYIYKEKKEIRGQSPRFFVGGCFKNRIAVGPGHPRLGYARN